MTRKTVRVWPGHRYEHPSWFPDQVPATQEHGRAWVRACWYGNQQVWLQMYHRYDRYKSYSVTGTLAEWFKGGILERKEWLMRFVSKVANVQGDKPKVTAVLDPLFSKAHPALWEYLTAAEWEDGSPRKTATITLFLGPQGLAGTLNDREAARSLFAAAKSISGVLQALEEQAADPNAVWRHDRNQTGSSKRVK